MFPSARSRLIIVLGLLATVLVLGTAGCDRGADDPVLAVVGDVEILASQYENRLALLEEGELPRDETGRPRDMSLPEGKSEFLTTMINKELMVAKATQLGYRDEPRIAAAHKSMEAYEAALAMGQDVINSPAGEVTFEEFDAFYERLGEIRRFTFIVTNFETEARAAVTAARGGMDWDDVVDRYHKGDIPDNGLLEVTVPWGRFDSSFEGPAFAIGLGEISEPVGTEFGWWVLRLDEITEGQKPDKEGSRVEILEQIHRRKMGQLQKDFRYEIYDKYSVTFDDDALEVIWNALPRNELMVDPVTDKPVPQDELADLDLRADVLDMPFYSYVTEGETHAFFVGDFKTAYDRMNTFQRPKQEQMVGGLKGNVLQEVEKHLMNLEAREKGYYERGDVRAKVRKKLEEIMVTSLYGELVTIDEHVGKEAFDTYWNEHADLFRTPEMRSGRLIIAMDEAEAAAARQAVADGALWREVVQQYGTDNANKARSGKMDNVSDRATGPVAEMMFAMAEGELGQPFPVGDGRYAIMRCERILPGQPGDPVADREKVINAIHAQRKEDLFKSLLAEWNVEFGVTRYDENLADVKSWRDLTFVEAPGEPVARN